MNRTRVFLVSTLLGATALSGSSLALFDTDSLDSGSYEDTGFSAGDAIDSQGGSFAHDYESGGYDFGPFDAPSAPRFAEKPAVNDLGFSTKPDRQTDRFLTGGFMSVIVGDDMVMRSSAPTRVAEKLRDPDKPKPGDFVPDAPRFKEKPNVHDRRVYETGKGTYTKDMKPGDRVNDAPKFSPNPKRHEAGDKVPDAPKPKARPERKAPEFKAKPRPAPEFKEKPKAAIKLDNEVRHAMAVAKAKLEAEATESNMGGKVADRAVNAGATSVLSGIAAKLAGQDIPKNMRYGFVFSALVESVFVEKPSILEKAKTAFNKFNQRAKVKNLEHVLELDEKKQRQFVRNMADMESRDKKSKDKNRETQTASNDKNDRGDKGRSGRDKEGKGRDGKSKSRS